MRVKIVRCFKYPSYYDIYVWRWWLPIWVDKFPYESFSMEEAERIAREVLNPVQKEFI